jgi:hypothetical protein
MGQGTPTQFNARIDISQVIALATRVRAARTAAREYLRRWALDQAYAQMLRDRRTLPIDRPRSNGQLLEQLVERVDLIRRSRSRSVDRYRRE